MGASNNNPAPAVAAESALTETIELIPEVKDVKAYPNPITQGHDLILTGHNIRQIQVVTTSGTVLKVIDTTPINQFALATGDLPKGLIIISTLQEDGLKVTKKVLIQ